MSWWGKVIGGAFGFLTLGPLGALLGAALGHSLDSGFAQLGYTAPGDRETIQTAFFTAVFAVMGHIAKADGRVTQIEIQVAEALMDRMRLNKDQRRTAVQLFTEGKKPDFPLESVLAQFRNVCLRQPSLLRMFIEILLDAALVDGALSAAERQILHRVCASLGITPTEFAHLERMRTAGRWSGGASAPAAAAKTNPYAALGIDRQASNAEIKRAYRKLMSQHHPDKLVSKGLPEEMMALAKDRVREIRSAYDEIKAERGFK